MVRISDILKNIKKKKTAANENEEEKKPFPAPNYPEASLRPPEQGAPQQPEPVSNREEKIKISPIIMEKGKLLNMEDCKKTYDEIMSFISDINHEVLKNYVSNYESITECVNRLAEQLMLGNESLLEMPCTSSQNYPFAHELNVCIYSLKIGLELGYDKTRLTELGASALFHDIGMIKYLDIANLRRTLSPDEYNEIKKHVTTGAELLKKITGIPEIVIDSVAQSHERIDGSGYCKGIKGDLIKPYAKIIGLSCVYDAITHPRAYRDRFMPLSAMQELLKRKSIFEYRLLKILINEIGIFPLGSLVQLNTRETGRVVKINRGLPMRPVVKIIYDRENKKLDHTKVVDLAEQPTIYIKQSLKKAESKDN